MVNGKVTPPTVKEEEKCGRDRASPLLPPPSLSWFVLNLAMPPRVLYPMCLKCSCRAARSICTIAPFDGDCAIASCVAARPPNKTVMQRHTNRLKLIRCSISSSLEGKRGRPFSALDLRETIRQPPSRVNHRSLWASWGGQMPLGMMPLCTRTPGTGRRPGREDHLAGYRRQTARERRGRRWL